MKESKTASLISAFYRQQVADRSLAEAYRAIDSETDFSVETDGDNRIIRISNETGEGIVRFAEIMPGIHLSFNDFNMDSCFWGVSSDDNHLSINYCKSGRIEQAMPGGPYAYTAQGDFKISDFEREAGTYVFPTGHYQGVTLDFDIDLCQKALEDISTGFAIDIAALRAKYCRGNAPYVIHGFSEGERIFGDLYDVKLQKFKTYAQIAALNALVILDRLDYREENQALEYFHQAQVERIKRAHDLMTEDLTTTYTVEQLAKSVGVPATAFKLCFKGVYGAPPFSYLRAYRMDRAAEMLRNTDRPIADVGVSVGYDSPSKFTAAFRAVMGTTPSSYRQAT